MSIASEIQRLSGVRSDIFTSITNKGVTVPVTATLSSCPTLIDSITAGGGVPNCIINSAYTAQGIGTTTIPFTATQIANVVYSPSAFNLPFSSNYFGEGEGGWNLTKRQIIELSSYPVSSVILADAWDSEWEWNPTLFLNYGGGRYLNLNDAYYLSSDYPGTSATITIPASSMSGVFTKLNEEVRRGWGNTYSRWTACGMDEVFGAIHPPAWRTDYFENNPPTGNWVSADVAGDKITSATNPNYNQMSQWGGDFNFTIDNSFADIFDNLSAYKITFKLSSDSIGVYTNNEVIRFSYATNSGDDNFCGTWIRTQTEGSVFEMTGTISGFGSNGKPATYPVYLNFPYTDNNGKTAQPLNGVVEFTYLSGAQIVYPYPGYAPTTTGNVVVSGDGKYKFNNGMYYSSANRNNTVTYNDGPSTAFSDTRNEYTEYLNDVTGNLKHVVTSYNTTSFTANGYNYQWGNSTTSYSSNLNVIG